VDFSDRVLGAWVARQLRARHDAVILRIGRDAFAREDLAHVSCFHFTAAANLSAILNRTFEVKDTRDVFEHITPAMLALPRLGSVAIAVLGAAFEAKGLGGTAPLETWVRRHTPKDAPIHTFASLKGHDAAEAAAESKQTKSRVTARRYKAHRLRVSRFTKRQQRAS
jgi:hypothetical protein